MSDNKKKSATPNIVNRKAHHDFAILKKIEAGVVLQGSEIKSCRDGKVQLQDSFAVFERGELYLYKAHISEYKQSGPYYNHPPTRKRKLLLHKSEMRKLERELETSGTTLVPLRLYFVRGFAKIEVAVAKGKSKYDKRETIKKKDEQRSIDKTLRRDRK